MCKKYDICWKHLGEELGFILDSDETDQDLIILMGDVSAAISLINQARIKLVSTNLGVFRQKSVELGHCINDIQSSLNRFIKDNK